MRNAFFVVESPMQLITAIEANEHFKPSKSVLFIRYNEEDRNDGQINKILSYGKFDSKYSIKIKEYSKFAYIKLLYVYALLILYRPSVLFIGDYKANFMKMIYRLFRKEKCIFLDDGAQSSYIFYQDPKANMFSYFKFPVEENTQRLYIHNTFPYFRGILKHNKKEILDKTVYFIGAPLLEKNMISAEQFDLYFSKVANFYLNQGYKIKYLPHRHEDNEKLKKYSNVEVMVLDESVELYMLHANALPSCVASFYSAALYTIQQIFSEQIEHVQSFYFPTEIMMVREDTKLKIESVYKTLGEVITVNINY